MANTALMRVARAPSVDFEPNSDGTVTATLDCYRKKANGDIESIVITFENLSVEQVACIGRGAWVAVYRAKKKVVEKMDAAYNLIITPGAK